MNFYLALLDSECKIVLGHNWLTHYNPSIDWVLNSIDFRTRAQGMPTPSTPSVSPVLSDQPVSGLANHSGSTPSDDAPDRPPLTAPHISLINAAAYMHACKLEGYLQFQLQLHLEDSVKARSSTTSSIHWTYPVSWKIIMTMLTSLVRRTHPPYHLIVTTISKSSLKKGLLHPWGPSIHFLWSSLLLSGCS